MVVIGCKEDTSWGLLACSIARSLLSVSPFMLEVGELFYFTVGLTVEGDWNFL